MSVCSFIKDRSYRTFQQPGLRRHHQQQCQSLFQQVPQLDANQPLHLREAGLTQIRHGHSQVVQNDRQISVHQGPLLQKQRVEAQGRQGELLLRNGPANLRLQNLLLMGLI